MISVSIVMPTYNQARFLSSAVSSVLTQTYSDFEFIVINDGSTDETSDILSKISDRRLRIISQENSGASAALNAGFASAKGRYLTWLASDNLYKPLFLERTVERISSADSPGLVYTCFENIDENGRLLNYYFQEPYFRGLLLENPGLVGVGFLYTRELYEAVGDYRDLVCNDLDYWLRAARNFSFAFIPEVLAANRQHAEMQTVLKRSQLLSEVDKLLERERRQIGALEEEGLSLSLQILERQAMRFARAIRARGFPADAALIVVGRDPESASALAHMLCSCGIRANSCKSQDLSATKDQWILPLDRETEDALRGRFRILPLKGPRLRI